MVEPNKLASADFESRNHDHEEEVYEELFFESARVYDLTQLGEEIPAGFDAVKIYLDGSLQADLSWTKEKKAAEEYVRKGLRIFWEINLGLFNELPHSISHQSQFLSLCLSLEHFRDTLWQQYKHQTVGVCLYRGSANFVQEFYWDEGQTRNYSEFLGGQEDNLNNKSLFCSNVCSEFLNLLAARLPDALVCFILLDATEITDSLLTCQLLSKERFTRFCIGVKGPYPFGGEFGWDQQLKQAGGIGKTQLLSKDEKQIVMGICLPPLTLNSSFEIALMKACLDYFLKEQIPFKVIPESILTTEWDGLDYLLVLSAGISPQGRRKLNGFCAAGGTVLSLGKPLQVVEEISLENDITLIKLKQLFRSN